MIPGPFCACRWKLQTMWPDGQRSQMYSKKRQHHALARRVHLSWAKPLSMSQSPRCECACSVCAKQERSGRYSHGLSQAYRLSGTSSSGVLVPEAPVPRAGSEGDASNVVNSFSRLSPTQQRALVPMLDNVATPQLTGELEGAPPSYHG